MNFVGKPIYIDYNQMLITFEMGFVEENVFSTLEKHIESDKFIRLTSHSLKKFDYLTDKQHKYWFILITHLLKHFNVPINSENIMGLHYELKKAYFPVEYIVMESLKIPQIPSITSMSKQQMREILDRIINDYQLIGLNFTNDL
jgi:hypothetical protein